MSFPSHQPGILIKFFLPGNSFSDQERKILGNPEISEVQCIFPARKSSLSDITAGGFKKICRLSWLTNSALVYEPKCVGEGGVAVSRPMCTAVHRSPNKLWRSNSIFNLCITGFPAGDGDHLLTFLTVPYKFQSIEKFYYHE
jgi:hypothetical protein